MPPRKPHGPPILPPDGSPPSKAKKQVQAKEEPPEEPEPEYLPKSTEDGRHPSMPPIFTRLQPQEDLENEFNALKELFNPGINSNELDARADVNDLQIIHIARGRAIARHFGIKGLTDFIDDQLRLSLSKNRKSRKEFVSAFQSARMGEAEVQADAWSRLKQNLRG